MPDKTDEKQEKFIKGRSGNPHGYRYDRASYYHLYCQK